MKRPFRLWNATVPPRKSRPRGRTHLHCEVLDDRILPTGWFVSPNGLDSNSGTNAAHPLKTIQNAINQSQNSDFILLAAGTYTYNGAYDSNYFQLGENGVAVVLNKQLKIQGGFNNTFTQHDDANFQSVIDGGGTTHGVFLLSSDQTPGAAALDLQDVTVAHSFAQPKSMQGNNLHFSGTDLTYSFGGGLSAVKSYLSATNVVFSGDTAGGAAGAAGGLAYGGAVPAAAWPSAP